MRPGVSIAAAVSEATREVTAAGGSFKLLSQAAQAARRGAVLPPRGHPLPSLTGETSLTLPLADVMAGQQASAAAAGGLPPLGCHPLPSVTGEWSPAVAEVAGHGPSTCGVSSQLLNPDAPPQNPDALPLTSPEGSSDVLMAAQRPPAAAASCSYDVASDADGSESGSFCSALSSWGASGGELVQPQQQQQQQDRGTDPSQLRCSTSDDSTDGDISCTDQLQAPRTKGSDPGKSQRLKQRVRMLFIRAAC